MRNEVSACLKRTAGGHYGMCHKETRYDFGGLRLNFKLSRRTQSVVRIFADSTCQKTSLRLLMRLLFLPLHSAHIHLATTFMRWVPTPAITAQPRSHISKLNDYGRISTQKRFVEQTFSAGNKQNDSSVLVREQLKQMQQRRGPDLERP